MRLMRRAAALACIALTAAGCAESAHRRAGQPHVLTIATGQGDPNSLNIHMDTSAVTGYVSELTGAFLARYDKDGRPIPDLATAIPSRENGGISRDGKTITWHLRHGVRWSDGAPFTGDDVVFSVHAIMNTKNDEEQGQAGFDLIDTMDQPDPYTVVMHLKRPYGSFLPLYFGTAANEPNILPKHVLGGLPDFNQAPYNSVPIGTGPFRVTAWRRGDAIEMERNPYYWKGVPKLERITFKLLPSFDTVATQLATGELDVWPLMSPSFTERMKGTENLHVEVVPNFRTTNVDFQMVGRPNVADVRVREAIRFAIDRAKMVATILHGYGFLHDGVVIPLGPLDEHQKTIPHDLEKAKALLASAGWLPGADGIRVRDGKRLTLQLVFPTGTKELDSTVEVLRSQLRDAGIEIDSKSYNPSVFRALPSAGGILYTSKWDIAVYPRTLEAVSDVTGMYSCQTRPPNGLNATRYCNPTVDRLLADTEAAYDEKLRVDRFARVQAQIDRDVPTILLYVWKGGAAWNNAVTGYHPPLLTPFDDMMNVDVSS
jgi:peptide/nickel transport system substrate-binding protein